MRSWSAAHGCLPSDPRWYEFARGKSRTFRLWRRHRASCSISRTRPRRSALPAGSGASAAIDDVLANSMPNGRDETAPWLLAPCDLQAIKASGVTFVASLLERVIEEQARGDAAKAAGLAAVDHVASSATTCAASGPARPKAQRLKDVLIAQGVVVAVSRGRHRPRRGDLHQGAADVGGRHRRRHRHPSEVGVEQSRAGDRARGEQHAAAIVGATLGNDVNLRDFEGRSALLLGKAKDNNASCAIGPFIRLFDDALHLDDGSAAATSRCTSTGPDGFALDGTELDVEDQPRSARPRRADDRPEPPVPGRPRAVPRHDVRADEDRSGAGQGLHPRGRRHRDHRRRRRSARSSTASTTPTASRRGRSARWR